MYAEIHPLVNKSGRVSTAGIDYADAARAGLTEDEVFALSYFADVENWSLRYLRALLSMKTAYEPDVSAFLATWNYEEYFHGYELERLLRACQVEVARDRRVQRAQQARLSEKLEFVLVPLLSRLYEADFPAVYFSFGALHELTTLRGYESLAARTRNAALKTLCLRIAKQERRHFAWYFQRAKRLLKTSARARFLTRQALRLGFRPVGASLHSDEQVLRLFRVLFYPRAQARALMGAIDARFESLPGVAGLSLLSRYFERAGVI